MPATLFRPPPRRALWALALLAAVVAWFLPATLVAGIRTAAAEPGAGTANNPWPTDCNMRIGVVVDRSHSIRAASGQNPALVRSAVGDLADRLGGTGASMAVWSFSTLASGYSGPNPLGGATVEPGDYPSIGFTSLGTAAGTAAVISTVNAIPFELPPDDPTDPARDRLGATNWEAGLGHSSHGIPGAVAPNGDRPRDADLLVFLTDGNPTIHNARLAGEPTTSDDDHVNAALGAAEEVKTTGAPTRIVAVGVGDVNAPNLERVTGGHPGAEEFEDYWLTDFSDLGDALFDVATRMCGGRLVVRKLVPGVEPGSWVPRPGWSFDLSFPGGDPAFLEPGAGLTTGADGAAEASWLNPQGDTDVTVTETLEPGQRLAGVSCETTDVADRAGADVRMRAATSGSPSFTVTVPRHHEVVCDVRNYPQGPALTLDKAVEPASLPTAGDVTFTLTVTNPDAVEPVRIDALLDDHFGDLFDRDNPHVRDNTCDDAEPGSRVMAPGATGSCSFVARVEPAADGGPHVDVATLHGVELLPGGGEGDPVDVTDDATVTFTDVAGPDLSVVKDDGTDTLAPGGEATYALTVANHGGVDATGVTLVDELPAGVTFVSATEGGVVDDGADDPARGDAPAVVWPWFGLAAGEQRTVEVTVRLDDDAEDGAEVRNVAVAHDDGTHGDDPNPDDNTGVDVDHVGPGDPDDPPVDPDPGSSAGGALPRTGGDVAELALWGGGLVAAGVALVGLARRAPGRRLRLRPRRA